MPLQLVIGATLVAVFAYMNAWRYRVLKARKQYLQFRFARIVVTLLAYLAATAVLTHQGLPAPEAVLLGAIIGSTLGPLLVRAPRRTRYIPRNVKRAVLERDLGGSQEFNSRLHAIDHIVPYSKGGSSTVDNLRVLPRSENARKGKRMPTRKDYKLRVIKAG